MCQTGISKNPKAGQLHLRGIILYYLSFKRYLELIFLQDLSIYSLQD